MTLLLALLFLVVPIAELFVLVQVSSQVGVLNALALMVLISVGGAWLTKHAGLGVLRRLRATVEAGRVPSAELVDGFLVLLGGALLLTPGFLTDAVALLLLLPPTRAGVRGVLIRQFRSRAGVFVTGGTTAGTYFRARRSSGARDVDGWEAEGWDTTGDRGDRGPDPNGPREELGP
jgi:UPF0716 protein FxsA